MPSGGEFRGRATPPGSNSTIDAAALPAAGGHGLLILTYGPGSGRVFPIGTERGPVRIGRGTSCEICIDDPSLSRLHATIQSARGEHYVRDEDSRNGTLRNGVAVDFASPLEDGDRLTLGSVRFRFTRADDSETETLVGLFGKRQAAQGAANATAPALRRVVRTPGMRSVFEQGERAAKSSMSILILGETGVGKEVLAEAIHQASPRAAKELLSINCAALTESLLESELFGHERGAFTGAVSSKAGLIESAEGGTVFFDEVGELPLSTQVKLLRVLEDHRVLRVGSRSAKPIDVRFIAATNRDLEAAVDEGTFRKDLFYRLNAITLNLPALRERREDILELADALLAEANALAGGTPRTLTGEARDALLAYDWPGNVRELRNAIERAVVLSPDTELTVDVLPPSIRRPKPSRADNRPLPGSVAVQAVETGPTSGTLGEAVELAERDRVLATLEAHGGNQTHAAEALGISRRTLVARLTQWKLTKPRRR